MPSGEGVWPHENQTGHNMHRNSAIGASPCRAAAQFNKITGPNAGGLRQLPMRTPMAARVGQFCRSSRDPRAADRSVGRPVRLPSSFALAGPSRYRILPRSARSPCPRRLRQNPTWRSAGKNSGFGRERTKRLGTKRWSLRNTGPVDFFVSNFFVHCRRTGSGQLRPRGKHRASLPAKPSRPRDPPELRKSLVPHPHRKKTAPASPVR